MCNARRALVALASGALLKASVPNGERHPAQAIRQGDRIVASWSPTVQVVLTS